MRSGFAAKLARLGAAAAAVAMLAGCGGGAAQPGGQAPAQGSARAAATGGTAGQGSAAAGGRLQRVNLRLPWLVTGYDGAFVIARDKGYYRQAGLDVNIEEGKGSLFAAENVANGSDTFALSDDSTVAQLISRGAKLRVLATFVQESPLAFIHSPSITLRSAADLKGRTVITDTGGATQQLMAAVLQRANLTMKDIHFEAIAASALASTFAAHPDDLLAGFTNSLYPQVLKLVPKATFTLFSRLGVNTLSLGLVTTDREIRAHPDVVRRFVAASVKGWAYALAHQDETVRATLKAFPKTNAFILQKSLYYSAQLDHTPATQGKPLGWMASSDWTSTLQILHRYAGVKKILPLADYYTNRYVPAA